MLSLYSSASLLFSGGRDNVIRVWVCCTLSGLPMVPWLPAGVCDLCHYKIPHCELEVACRTCSQPKPALSSSPAAQTLSVIAVQDMETLVCRQTLSGHKNDVLCISGLQLSPFPRIDSAAVMNGGPPSSSSPAQVCSSNLYFFESMFPPVCKWARTA